MKLYIVRHGIAQKRDAPGVTCDDDRVLTRRGRKRTLQAARGLKALQCRPERVGTSPLPRAEQTARIIAEVLCPDASFEVCQFLAPGGKTADLLDWLTELEEQSVMIVGHMPDVAIAASELLPAGQAGLSNAETVPLVFKKTAVCCIHFDGVPETGQGELEWLMQPRQLRSLGQT